MNAVTHTVDDMIAHLHGKGFGVTMFSVPDSQIAVRASVVNAEGHPTGAFVLKSSKTMAGAMEDLCRAVEAGEHLDDGE